MVFVADLSKKIIRLLTSLTPYEIVSRSSIQKQSTSLCDLNQLMNRLNSNLRSKAHVRLLLDDLDLGSRNNISALLGYSYSQLSQDLFALSQLPKGKIKGFFVEFGATDGIQLSNTYLLERKLGWGGILAEPARIWHDKLLTNRRCCIDTRCVSSSTGKVLDFLEVLQDPLDTNLSPELSVLKDFSDSEDWASAYRQQNSVMYPVQTISLNDLLAYHDAPSNIEYLSIDTEGSEYTILKSLDFTKYRFNAITVEHNFGRWRDDIRLLMKENGYRRVYEDISLWDDWYIPAN